MNKIEEIRQMAENDLVTFIKLVHPQRLLGSIHEELCLWWTRPEAKSHQLVLLPRDHGKSAFVAYRVAWEITRNPAIRVLYISSTANLATKQLKFIKDILTSPIYRRYWPEMIHPEEGKREKWTETEFSVDHPLRKAEAIRDPTVFTAGLTTGITGLHCDIAVLDDVVVKENALTEEGREKVKSQYSLLSSIEGADAKEWIVGTRYHPNDLYNDLLEAKIEVVNEDGEIEQEEQLYEIFERRVENIGDGTGDFLWPRAQRSDGKWFGFNISVLAKKKAQYFDKTQFRAQYYNDPNDIESAAIDPKYFQYYNPMLITRQSGNIYFNNRKLNVYAAIDFAFSINKKADYTAIVVIGVDHDYNYYVLDITRFKTDSIKEYYDNIVRAHQNWGFRKIRAEVTAAQAVIVRDLKEHYIRVNGLSLVVDEYRPMAREGSKMERIHAILQPKYENGNMWHFRGGNNTLLEDELVHQNPAHDDIKDSLANAVDVAVKPSREFSVSGITQRFRDLAHPRFGGIN
jgi:phage terminase large subunit-like protein